MRCSSLRQQLRGDVQHVVLGVAAVIAASGCGHAPPGLSDAIHASRQALHLVAVAAEVAAKEWAAQVDARIAYCRGQDLRTQERRAECMGPWGDADEFDARLESFRLHYDTTADALQSLETAAVRVQDFTTRSRP